VSGARKAAAPDSTSGGGAFALVIVLVALNLRAFLTSSSPLLEPIRHATGIGFHAVALLTVLPMFAMGAMSLFGAAVGQRVGARAGVAAGLGAIAFACASRYVAGGAAALLWSAALAGAGVGLVQALMPGVVKQAYPARIGVMTGLYSAAIMGGGGLGAMASPWVAHAFGGAQSDWHAGLAIWALLATFALLYWLNMRRFDPAAPAADLPRQTLSWLRCFGSRRAWLLAACFGLINGGYTSLVAWLPHFYAQRGWSAQQGGSVLALMTAAQVVAALAMPALARSRGRDLRPWLMLTLLAQLAGFCALTLDLPVPAVGIALVLGFGLGGAFALCMVLALDHLGDPAQAGALAGFMQGVGFMIAALAPFVTGWVREHTGGFSIAWAYLAVVAAVLLPLMLCFDPRRYAAATAGLFGGGLRHRAGPSRPRRIA
jgi:CP family cyanate transporter-like MFS transporter